MRISHSMVRRTGSQQRESLTLAQVEALADAIPITDTAGEAPVSIGSVFFLQLFIHGTQDTVLVDGIRHNRYSGIFNDGFGLYPERMQSPIIDETTGKFHIDKDWGLMHFVHSDKKRKFVVGDMHRASENHFLSAAHLFVHKLHNRILDEGIAKTYEESKKMTLACIARVCCDAFVGHVGPNVTESHMLNGARRHTRLNLQDRTPGAIMSSLESALAVMRWAHAMLTSEIKGVHIFTREVSPADIYMGELMEVPAKAFGHDLSTAMCEMNHIAANKHIAMLTMGKHAQEPVATFVEVANMLGMTGDIPEGIDETTPLWLGMLIEGAVAGTGVLGDIGGEIVCVCASDALQAPQGEGLYMNVADINKDTASVIDFVEGSG